MEGLKEDDNQGKKCKAILNDCRLIFEINRRKNLTLPEFSFSYLNI